MKYEYESVVGNEHDHQRLSDVTLNTLGDLAANTLIYDLSKIDAEWPELDLSALDAISNPESRASFKEDYAATAEMFKLVDLPLPNPQKFFEAGVNLDRMGTQYAVMTDLDEDPVLVVAPVLPLGRWVELYEALHPVGRHNAVNIHLENELIEDDWLTLNRGWAGLKPAFAVEDPTEGVIPWTLRLIPRVPSEVSRNRPASRNYATDLEYPMVAEYLCMQALQSYMNQDLLDLVHGTWLSNPLSVSINGQIQDFFLTGRYAAPVGQLQLDLRYSHINQNERIADRGQGS